MRKKQFLAAAILMVASVICVSAQANEGDAYEKFLKLSRSAPQAYKNGDPAAAETQAKELLAMTESYRADWNYGNAVHAGHLVLGIIAADAGKMSEAKKRLLESVAEANLPYGFVPQPEQPWEQRPKPGPWKASPQMDSFGPDMSLANELLKKGEKDTVVKYLDLCGKFWNMDYGNLAKWKKQIEAGESPDFGPNMIYFFNK